MKIFIQDLKNGDFITEQVFALEEIQRHKTRSQKPYYSLVLQDKTGEILGKIWENDFPSCHLTGLENDDVVIIDAEINIFNGKLQLIIKKMDRTDDYNISDLLQTSDKNIDEMESKLFTIIDSVKNKHLHDLLTAVFSDKTLLNRFKRTPAGIKVHHDFVGGLLEHCIEVIDIAEPMLPYYPEADRDLVISGVILHDIGKIIEIEVKKTAMERTQKGKLIGHVILALDIVKKYIPKDFPETLWMKLEHIIISHQRELEFGSPVRPATIEAALVHASDYASSYVRQFQKAIRLGEGISPGFSEYQKWIETEVFLE